MKFGNSIIASILFLSITACNELIPKEKETVWIQKSPALESAQTRFVSEVYENSVLFRYELDFKQNFSFPIDSVKDTLHICSFYLEILHQHNKIKIDSIFSTNNYINLLADSQYLIQHTPKYHLHDNKIYVDFLIPLVAFHSINEGKNTFELHFFNDSLFANKNKNQSDYTQKLVGVKQKLFEGRILFDLEIPAIYKRNVQLDSIELIESRNADFTLINRGFADIFWEFHDAENKRYFRSDVVSQTKSYQYKDHFSYYYLSGNQKISIHIFDWDMLSRNDYLGHISITMQSFDSTENKKNLTFDNIQSLALQISKESKIN